MKKFSFIGIVFITGVLLLNSCTFFDPTRKLQKTPEQIPLESFLPANTTTLFSAFSTNETELRQAQKIEKLLLQNYQSAIYTFLLSKIFEKNLAANLAVLLERETNMPLLISFHPDETKQIAFGFFAVSRIEKPEEFRKQIAMLKTEISDNLVVKEENGDIMFEQKNPALFGLFKANYLFFASSPELFPTSIPPKDTPFLRDPVFREHLKKAPNSFSNYLFSKAGRDFLPGNVAFQNLPAFFPKNTAAISFIEVEEDGVRSFTYTKIPQGEGIDPLFRELAKGSPQELAQKIVAENPIVYFEGHNLMNQLRLQKKIFLDDPFFAVRRGEKFFQDLEQKIGLSFEGDLAPLLSRNFAFLIEDQGKILPGVSFIIDASANREIAEKVFKKLDTALSSLFTLLQFRVTQLQEENSKDVLSAEPPPLLIEQREGEAYGTKVKQIVFYPRRLYEVSKTPPLFGMLDEPWGLTYGLSNENLLFISTRLEFPTETLLNHASYKNLLPSISGFSETEHSLFLVQSLLQYGDRFIELGKTNEYLTDQQLKGFEIARTILKNFRGFISGTRRKKGWVENQAFLRMGGVAR